MTLEENKIYYNEYGGKWLIQFNKIEGRDLICHYITYYDGTISSSGLLSSCYPDCMEDRYKWREATAEEIAIFERMVEKATGKPINNFQSLYEIY